MAQIGTSFEFIDEEQPVQQPEIGTSFEFIDEEQPIEQPIEQPVEQPKGLLGKAREMITGEARMTPEIEAMPTIGELPELSQMSIAGLKSAFSTLTASPEEAVKALQSNFPGMQTRTDEKGNVIVKSTIDNKEYVVNKPGLDLRDVIRGGITAAMFAPTARVAGLGAKMAGAALTQAGIEAAQKATGGEFDVEQVPLAAATEMIGPAIGGVVRGARGVREAVRPKLPLSAAEEAVAGAERAGITPLTTDIRPPQTFPGKLSQAITERIPVAGTGELRKAQQVERSEAVRSVLREYGAYQFARASDDVMQDLARKRGKDINKYTNLKNQVIGKLSPKGEVNTNKTIDTIGREISKLESLKTQNVQPVINLLDDFKKSIEGQNLKNIELIREQLGQKLKNQNLSSVRSIGDKSLSLIDKSLREDTDGFIKNVGEIEDFNKWEISNKQFKNIDTIDKEISKLQSLEIQGLKPIITLLDNFKKSFQGQDLKNIELIREQLGQELKNPDLASVRSTGDKSLSLIYKSLREDMGDFIKSVGERRDFTKWNVANKQLFNMKNELEAGTLKSALKKGEATPELVKTMLFSKKPSEIKLLYRNLSPQGKDKAKIAIMQEVVEKSGGVDEVTPAKFLKQMSKMEKSLNIFLNKRDKQVMNGLIKALKLTQQAEISGFKPPTGSELVPFATPTLLSWLVGGDPALGIIGTAGIGAAARMYESKPLRNLLLKLAVAPAGKEKEILEKLTPVLQGMRQIIETKEE